MRANAVKHLMLTMWIVVALSAGACSPFASKGTMPPPGVNAQVDASGAPDFVAVASEDGGIAGYAPKEFLFPEPTTVAGRPDDPEIPVYADDLRTLIGHMVPGKGYVPLDVDPSTVPTIPVQAGPSLAAPSTDSTSLTLYVRNATTQQAWFAVHLVGAQGYNNGGGVGCFNLVVGEQLVMVDRPPQDAGALMLRIIYRRTQANERPTLWVDVGSDGAISQGDGVPAWWVGEPQVC